MKLKLWQVDAFAAKVLEGNPAAVVPLEYWLPDDLMQALARENNLPMTAFFVPRGPEDYDLRWFSPDAEVQLCGHATLASAHVVLDILHPGLPRAVFHTRRGALPVTRGPNGRNSMSLPAHPPIAFDGPAEAAAQIGRALGAPPPRELWTGAALMAVWDDPGVIRRLAGPAGCADVLEALDSWGLIVTAPGGEDYDCVSRVFAPGHAIPEDAVTGSAHCTLAPYWAKRLGRKALRARQASPRGGDLWVRDEGERTHVAGDCALYLTGEIEL